MDYGNNSLSGFQQRETQQMPVKEEYEKGLIDVLKDKLSAMIRKWGSRWGT